MWSLCRAGVERGLPFAQAVLAHRSGRISGQAGDRVMHRDVLDAGRSGIANEGNE